jgi:type IV pilus assembly protein PilV
MMAPLKRAQTGSTLIEVLIAMLLFSAGMLSVGLILSHTVQLPKLATYRTTATHLAAGHIERMRANPKGNHNAALNFDGSFTPLSLADCPFPTCTIDSLTAMDKAYTQKNVRQQLPAGGLQVDCDAAPCTSGDLWLVWQEPSTFATLNARHSDNCPTRISNRVAKPAPRCFYVRFSL